MNHNERALAGLAWLAATLPTLAQQDCLNGNEITATTAYAGEVNIHLSDYPTAARIAARLGLSLDQPHNRGGEQTWWSGKQGDGLTVYVMTCDPPRIVGSWFSRECMDEVTA